MGNQIGELFQNETLNSEYGPCAIFNCRPSSYGQRLVVFKGIVTEYMTGKQVIKVFREKTRYEPETPIQRSRCYIENKEIAQMYLKKNGSNKISFLDLRKAEMDKVSMFTSQIRTSDKCHKRRLCEDDVVVFEQDLGKNFKTFIERDGTVSSNCCGKLQEFVHFVYNESKGQEIVTGLKGVRVGQNFKLTSPSMNSVSKKYGPDDFGEKAMLNFFTSHVCTDVCTQWPKPTVLHPFHCLETVTKTQHTLTPTRESDMPPPEYDSRWRLDFEKFKSRSLQVEPSAPPAYELVT
ncbi:uncharacterized protein LOC132549494 [Ylistrum balloti]|uniref:uncharacterized protein LOC132549494 n=1 Tax=Ylistrum balloti TaxID=509963 RepID=UPI002905BF16|nr:uncharacterized protein LOC132549494 [Ylistrum balloti]